MQRVAIIAVTALVGLGATAGPVFASGSDGSAGAKDGACPSTEARVVHEVDYVTDPTSELQRLDLFVPERAKPCRLVPIVVWVHGGGWAVGDKRANAATKAAMFNDLGYLFVSVNYRLSAPIGDPSRPVHPAHADDVGAAIAWLGSHAARYGGDGKQIALLGHSAGAHLVALVGTDPAYVARAGGNVANIRCVGSYDTASYDLVQRSAETSLVQNAFGSDEATLRNASPLLHLDDRLHLPAFQVVVRGTPDRRAAETAFADAARAAGGEVSVLDAAGLSHADVNRLIGAPGDTRMSPEVSSFVTGCLGQSS